MTNQERYESTGELNYICGKCGTKFYHKPDPKQYKDGQFLKWICPDCQKKVNNKNND